MGGVGTWGGGLLIFDMDNIDGPLTAGYSEDTISEEKIPSTMPMYNRPHMYIMCCSNTVHKIELVWDSLWHHGYIYLIEILLPEKFC